MSEIERLATAVGFSAEQREMLAVLLAEEGIDLDGEPPITPLHSQGDLPLSFSQQRLWFLQSLEPESPFYNIAVEVRLTGALDLPVLGRALAEVTRRHDALRSAFVELDGELRVRIAAPRPVHLPVVDLSALPAAAAHRLAGDLTFAEARRGFDLAAGILLRILVLKMGRGEHRVVLTLHHVVADGWSMGVLVQEMGALYGAFLRGGPSPLPELPFQYADFAAWQRSWLQGEVLEKELAHWRAKLEGAAPVLELPFDYPRPAQRSDRGATRILVFPAELTESVERLSRRQGVSLFMSLLAAFAALLGRYTGQQDLVIGYPVANRDRSDIEGMIGLFLNTLVLRVDLSGDPAFGALLGRVRDEVLEAQSHAQLPFERLVEELRVERSLSYNPLFQVLFVLQNTPASALEIPGLAVESAIVDLAVALFDLSCWFEKAGDTLLGRLEYSEDLFEGATIERLAGHYTRLLAGAVADPQRPLSQLPLLSPGERHQILGEWNDTATAYPGGVCLHELVAVQAERTPEAVAASFEGETLTYRELVSRARRLAWHLIALGVEPDGRVGVLLERSLEMIVALLGVLTAGAAYVPLDPSLPAERLDTLVKSAGLAVILTREKLAELAVAPSGERSVDVAEQSLAYVLFTSGSTGVPKGVMIPHRGIVNRLLWMQAAYGLTAADRVLQKTPFGFDVSLWEFFWPLITGARLVFARPEGHKDPQYLVELIAREKITTLHFVPSMLEAFLEAPGLESLTSLRRVVASGEALTAQLVRRFFARLGAAELHNLYGPTEASVDVSFWPCVPEPGSFVPIGRPIANHRLHVVDRSLELQPAGVPGELLLGGAGLARGYLGRPDLTAAVFIPDPFGVEPGERLYRTGDLVRQLADGNVQFLGRLDHQVKIRGFRIELGEIEAALLAHPAVREAVVVAIPGTGGNNQLVAYWVAADGAAPPVAELRAFLGKLLPEYMLPAIFVPLPALPLNPNGKVDRKALPAPAAAREALAGSAPPRNAREALLAEIWRGVLGLERVGIHDNFFRLGGDSILSIQVVARARKAGLLITARQFLDQQTIAGLAAVAEDAGAAGVGEAPVEGEAPLTPIQRRFFAEERRQPWRFNQAVMLVPRERLAAAPLAVALARLAEHHDALRLRFPREEDGWRQIHAPAGAVAESAPLLEIELEALPASERARALDGAAAQLQWGLDLARGPLFTAALFRLGGEAGERLLLTAHHLIVDGVSWRVLLEDLTAAYRQLAAGAAPELPAKTASWKHWAERLADFARAPQLAAAELPSWLNLPTSVLQLPIDLEREDGSAVIATFSAELGTAPTRALLNEAPEAYRTQVNDLLLAALARAFAAWTGESTLLIDLEGHGREEIFPGADLSRTVGWFTTVFPVALALPPGAGPREAILAVKEALRAVPRRGLGYGLLRYLAGPETGERLAALPAPQVLFNYLGRFDPVVGEGGLFAFAPEVARGAEGEAVADRHLFALDLLVLDGRLRVNWTFDPGRYFPATVERLARGFLAEVETLVAHCLSREAGGFTPSDFPLASIDQTALDRLLGNDRGVEDLYPLAPLQEGILFHSLYTSGADLYLEQFTAAFAGPFDVAAFAAAWQRVLERHAALRTAFVVEGVERPLQLVRREVELPWTVEDWRGLPAAELDARWQDLLAADRARGFDLARPPLMRLALVRTGEASHRLVWSSHHLIFDGWCFALLLTEVFTLYEAAVSGGEARLPAPRPYRDYIAWLAEREEEEAERFWQEVLRGFTAPTPVPFDHPTVPSGAHGSRPEDYFERKISLPAAQVGALEALAQRLQVTLNTLVQGAWALLLSQYAQAGEVVFGAVVSGRPAELPGVESMVGLFINTLPVRVEIPEGEATSGWLARLQASQFEQRQYQWTPLARVQTLAGLSAGESLFASLLVFENYPVDASVSARLGELRIDDVELGERTNYPLTLTVVARGDLTLRLIADRRFEPPTVQRMLGHLERFLAAFVVHPERPPRSLPFLSAAERHQLTVDWSGAPPRHPRAATIHGLFAEQAARTPGAVAVVWGDEELTYADLAIRSRRLAGRLLTLNLPPESRIAIVAERSPALIVGLLGILQAGGAYLPLDPELPIERLAFLLADAGATVILGEREALDSLPADLRLEGVRVLALDDEEEGGETPLLPEVAATDLAYVLYTSGSTGTPKGVAVPHRGVVRLVVGADWADLGPGETFLQLVHLTFDVSAFEIWAPLLNGGRLALYPGRRPALDQLAEVIARHGVTTMWLTSGLFNQMVHERLDGLRPLHQLVAGGDALSPPHVRRALAGLPGCTLIDGYGPTENSILTTSHAMTAADLEDERLAARVPIGRAVRGTEVYVLGADLRPVPVGVWGELVAGGDGVARCYLGRPALTAESFVCDPFARQPGARLYRTGDIVRWRADGVLEFLGRRDGQVKVRGIRIELGEIEAALARQPGVREAVVLVREDAPGDKRLVAYLVSAAGPGPSPEHLREDLRRSLPEPMVPAAIVVLEHLPLTANGKVDRRALSQIAPLAVREAASYTAPQGPIAELLAAIWAEVLGPGRVERVGAHDDFFALGGHSLLATQVIARLREAFGVELPVRALFEAPTVAALAARIGQKGRGAQVPPNVPVPREGSLPLSFAQQRLWFLDQLAPGSAAYNIPVAIELTGDLELAVLAAALAEVVRRHEALCTTFQVVDGEPVQVVAARAELGPPVIDLRSLPAGTREEEANRLTVAEARRPFDLGNPRGGSLLRVALLRLAGEQHAALLTMHHIVSDGWSMGVLIREVSVLYTACLEGRPSPLPELPIQYRDYALWQRSRLTGEVLEQELAFWREALAGIPVLQLPTDRPRPPVQTFRGAVRRFEVPGATTAALKALGQRQGGTLFMVLLAAFAVLLHRYTGQDDVAIGSPAANRTRSQFEGLIGFFVNTLVLRIDLSGAPSFAALFARVRRASVDAFSHQELPFEKVVFELQPERNLSVSPLFQVMFSFQNVPLQSLSLPGLTLRPCAVETRTAKFDLTLDVGESAGGLAGSLEHNIDLFDRTTVDRMLGHFGRLLEAVTAEPGASVADLPLLSAGERSQLLVEWNATDRPVPAGLVHEWIAAQAARTPEAVAVTFGAASLTYRELDRRANGLAWRLLDLGVGPEVRVGIALERSLEMVVGVLAVLKAGGAYVPLDPSYPAERLAFMVEDSGLATVLRSPLRVAEAAAAPHTGVGADNAAYVIYTSGSTGRPKGVQISHGALANFLAFMAERLGIGVRDVLLAVTSLSFDIAGLELYLPLMGGGRIVLASREEAADGQRLQELTAGATVLQATPATWRLLLDSRWQGNEGLKALCGGEALSPSLASSLLERVGALWNCYGPTETTIWSTVDEVRGDGPTLIGRPIANTEAYVLDRRGAPVPLGAPGELVLGGAGVARGYLGRPDLTAERFVPNPFGAPGSRLYRTGDLVRYRADGALGFLGRLDHQVKLRGFRVELGEVEAVLASHPAVRASAVVALADRREDLRLVAYVVVDAEASVAGTPAELRAFLKQALPDSMVPSSFVFLAALPLTPSGKVDRRALPAPDGASLGSGAELAAPATAVEEVLAEIWRKVLGVARVGRHDNFFDLGGHSLLLAELRQRLQERFGRELSMVEMFRHATVAAMAEHLAAGGAAETPPETPDRGAALRQGRERLKQRGERQARRAGERLPGGAR